MCIGYLISSGIHKYSILIEEVSYIGIGIAYSRYHKDHILELDAPIWYDNQCCVYYDNGVCYPKNGYDPRSSFKKGDIIDIYFDAGGTQVMYYRGEELLWKTNVERVMMERTLSSKFMYSHADDYVRRFDELQLWSMKLPNVWQWRSSSDGFS